MVENTLMNETNPESKQLLYIWKEEKPSTPREAIDNQLMWKDTNRKAFRRLDMLHSQLFVQVD